MIVLDASVAGAMLLPDERHVLPDATVRRLFATALLVPMHWHLELANVIRMAVRRRRLTREQAAASLDDASRLAPTIDASTSAMAWTVVSALAERHDLTVYDAAYLELAFRTGNPLATLDGRLRDAADRERVQLLDLAS